MESLAENYAQEQTEDILKALGQEITLAHYLLYSIEEDSDSYVLALISEAEEENFGQEMKTIKRKANVLLQPRKNPERGADGTLIDGSSYIAVGQNLGNVSEWKVIHKDDAGFWEVCYWYGEHLFLAGKNKVAVIKNAMNGGKAPEIILESKENRLTFPYYS